MAGDTQTRRYPDLVIDATSVMLSGNHVFNAVNLTHGGAINIHPYNGTSSSGWLNITAYSVFVDATSSIVGDLGGRNGQADNGGQGGDSPGPCAGGPGGSSGGGGPPTGDRTSRSAFDMGKAGGSGGAGGWGYWGQGCGEAGDPGGAGQLGGAGIRIRASIIEIHGEITVNGGNGGIGGRGGDCPCGTQGAGGGGGGGGGGASGGTILLDANFIDITNATMSTIGGYGGSGGQGGSGICTSGYPGQSGGRGAGGRIKIFFNTLCNSSSTLLVTGGTPGTTYFHDVGPVHDVAVLDLTPSSNETFVGETISIDVTVRNEGTETESFDLTTRYNEQLVGIQTVENLASGEERTQHYYWNTTLVPSGSYILSAEAETIDGETDIADNIHIDGEIVLHNLPRDLAVTSVVTSKTGCLPVETVGVGYPLILNATVENYGSLIEFSNVTLFVNQTKVDVQPVTLNPMESKTVTFYWTVSGFGCCVTLNASVKIDPVPDEANLGDNLMVYGPVLASIAGDVDGDYDVDIFDIVRMAGSYGVPQPNPTYDPNCDIDGDDDVDIFDIVIAAGHYGQECQPPVVNKVLVLVPNEIFEDLELRLERYDSDIDSFNLMIVNGSWIDPEDVRLQIQDAYNNHNISGCILVGDVGAAYFKSVNVHGTFIFPTDLYYMDLDGTWIDYELDGIFDNRTDPNGVEIWVSRIKPPTNNVTLLQLYFDKNHDFYTSVLGDYNEALAYINDCEFGQTYRVEVLKNIYNETDIVFLCGANATKIDYLETLRQGFETVWISCHGGPTRQRIEEDPVVWFDKNDAKMIENGSIFYLLHNCEVGRYDVEDYLAGWYVFADNNGLVALASTTVWESIDHDFFITANNNSYIGNAFLETIKHADERAKTDPIVARNLYYGAVLIGDPFILIGQSAS